MRRREFIRLAGSGLLWPLGARAAETKRVGVLMAIRLLEQGYCNFIVLEKAAEMGGTWRDNVYPGVACDVAAHLYTYSFARNPDWQTRYAGGADIWKYNHDVARRYGVLPHIQYGKEVRTAVFKDGTWQLTTQDGSQYQADVVVAAAGRLHHPVVPEIEGAESFAGAQFHTARWDQSVDLAGKRIGLIVASGDAQASGFGNRLVTELSGGQAQRVALARALAPRPLLLLPRARSRRSSRPKRFAKLLGAEFKRSIFSVGMQVGNADGTLNYTSAAGYTGADTITYTVTDGSLSATGTALARRCECISVSPAISICAE